MSNASPQCRTSRCCYESTSRPWWWLKQTATPGIRTVAHIQESFNEQSNMKHEGCLRKSASPSGSCDHISTCGQKGQKANVQAHRHMCDSSRASNVRDRSCCAIKGPICELGHSDRTMHVLHYCIALHNAIGSSRVQIMQICTRYTAAKSKEKISARCIVLGESGAGFVLDPKESVGGGNQRHGEALRGWLVE
jgi:hypothetical protein